MTDEGRRNLRRLLWRWGRVTVCCARKQREIGEYNDLIDGASDIRPQQLSDMPHGGETSDPTPKAADKRAELVERYQDRINELTTDIDKELSFARAVDEAVKTLGSAEANIIDLKYKRDYSYEKIARMVGYGADRVKQIERSAVDALAELIKIESC